MCSSLSRYKMQMRIKSNAAIYQMRMRAVLDSVTFRAGNLIILKWYLLRNVATFKRVGWGDDINCYMYVYISIFLRSTNGLGFELWYIVDTEFIETNLKCNISILDKRIYYIVNKIEHTCEIQWYIRTWSFLSCSSPPILRRSLVLSNARTVAIKYFITFSFVSFDNKKSISDWLRSRIGTRTSNLLCHLKYHWQCISYINVMLQLKVINR